MLSLNIAEYTRQRFVDDNYLGKMCPTKVQVNRSTIYDDVIKLYNDMPDLVHQLPIRVEFKGEDGIDFGGVGRDFFPAFWEQAYKRMFDGAALLAPVSHADIAMNEFSVLGKVMSHGYLCCGFIPTRIAYPVLASVLLGPPVNITPEIFVQSFSDFLSVIDRTLISNALELNEFSQDVKSSIINILSRFGCRDVPTPGNLKRILSSLAQHQFRSQPFAAISIMNTAIPEKHMRFWHGIDASDFYDVYTSLTASPSKVLEKIMEPLFNNPNEQRIFMYLQQYIGEMKLDDVKRFVRFITGSSVLTNEDISISFNALTGASRRPIAHTCSNSLELPYTYNTFLEFVEEFSTLLNNEEYCWVMNSV